jgi:hypothetical protein
LPLATSQSRLPHRSGQLAFGNARAALPPSLFDRMAGDERAAAIDQLRVFPEAALGCERTARMKLQPGGGWIRFGASPAAGSRSRPVLSTLGNQIDRELIRLTRQRSSARTKRIVDVI